MLKKAKIIISVTACVAAAAVLSIGLGVGLTVGEDNGHVHEWSAWTAVDNTNHHRTCSGCDAVMTQIHTDTDGDGVCDVCNYQLQVPHSHEWTAWTDDGNGRTHSATCSGCTQTQTESHVDADDNGICDVCGGQIETSVSHTHTWGQWEYYSAAQHMRECTAADCDGVGAVQYANHVDSDGDNLCDDCGYDMSVEVTGITISPAALTLVEGNSSQLTANVQPANATEKGVTWESSAPAVATVDQQGNVTAVSEGTATITATAQDGSGVYGTCAVTVNAASADVTYVTNITISGATTAETGGTVNLTADVLPADATDKTIEWDIVSGDATITQDGVVTIGATAGTVVVRATAQDGSGISDTHEIVVTAPNVPVTNISVTSSAGTTLTVGDSTTINVTVTPSNATNPAYNLAITQGSEYATLSGNTLNVTGAGTVTVTATAQDGSGVSGYVTITVEEAPVSNVPVTDIAINSSNGNELTVGDTTAFTAKISPSNATNKDVVWSIYSGGEYASLSGNTLTANAAGTVVIRATAQDGSGVTADYTITISEAPVTNVPVTNINVTSSAGTTLTVGDSTTINVTVNPSNATNPAYNLAITQGSDIAMLSGNTLTVNAQGTVVVTATAQDGSNVSGYITITVNPATPSGEWTEETHNFSMSEFFSLATGSNLGGAPDNPDDDDRTSVELTVSNGYFTVAAGVRPEESSNRINSQGAENAFRFTSCAGCDELTISFSITGASGSGAANVVTLSRVDADGGVLDTIIVSDNLSNSSAPAQQTYENLTPGTWILTSTRSIRLTSLVVTERTAPHICTAEMLTTHVAYQAATCTTAGNIEYWQCSECGKYYSDANAENEVASVIINELGHLWSTGYTYNGSQHWQVCMREGCSATDNAGDHDTAGANGSCSVCGYLAGHTHEYAEAQLAGNCETITYYTCTSIDNPCGMYFLYQNGIYVAATMEEIQDMAAHDLEYTGAIEATCTSYGAQAYWHCTACDGYWLDDDGDLGAEINYATLAQDIRVDMIAHDYSVQNHNNDQHWMQCSVCGTIDENSRENHTMVDQGGGLERCECGYEINQALADYVADYGTYEESMYVVMNSNAPTVTSVTYSLADGTDNTVYSVPSELITTSNGQQRIDMIGVKPGTYDINITMNTGTGSSLFTISDSENLAVSAYDRSGYAHFDSTAADDMYANGIGAYENDGTLKDGALVIYLTDDNKNDISGSAYVYDAETDSYTEEDITSLFSPSITSENKYSIGYFLNNRQYASADRDDYGIWAASIKYGAVDIRVIGVVDAEVNGGATMESSIEGLTAYDSTGFGGSEGDNGRMARMVNPFNITIEGVGEDASIFGWGLHFIASQTGGSGYQTYSQYDGVATGESFEVRNLIFENYPEDAIGMEGEQTGQGDSGSISTPVQRCWIHNNVFMPGYSSDPAETDKAEGDGSCDFKRGYNFTFSYNYLYGCHKTNLIGANDNTLQYNLTYHHNWWDNCGSRIPLARRANIHFYNNYVSVDPDYTGEISYVMSPRAKSYIFAEGNYFDGCKQIIKDQDADAVVKFYNNTFYACYGMTNPTQTATRDEAVASQCKDPTHGTDYSSFETNAELFYDPNGEIATDSVTARKDVMERAGVHGYGYDEAPAMNEMTPDQTVSVTDGTTTIDLNSISGNYSGGVLFNQGNVKGKGQLATFTLASEAAITVAGTAGNEYAYGVLVGSDGTVWIDNIASYGTSGANVTLPAGTYVISSGELDKEFAITALSFTGTTAAIQERLENAAAALEAVMSIRQVDLSDEPVITAARHAYNALSASDKAYVIGNFTGDFDSQYATQIAALVAAEDAISDILIQNVIDLINDIGTVNENSYSAINAARTAYNALSTSLQSQVTNYQDLVDAEAEFERYAIINVENMITALGATDGVTDQAEVQALLEDYNAANDAYLALDDSADEGETSQRAQVDADLVAKLNDGIAYLESVLDVYDFKTALMAMTEVTNSNASQFGALVTQYEAIITDGTLSTLITEEERTHYSTLYTAYEEIVSQAIYVSFTSGNSLSNFVAVNANGETAANPFTIVAMDNTSDVNVTINGTAYENAIKMNSAFSAQFTIATDMNVTLYFAGRVGNTIIFTDSNGAETTVDVPALGSNGYSSVTVTLTAGTYTLLRGSGESRVALIEFTPAT